MRRFLPLLVVLALAGPPSAFAATISVSDKSSSHDFVLTGPGIRNKKITTVPFMGTKTVTVTLKKGTYTYYCTPHRSIGMKGTFKVK